MKRILVFAALFLTALCLCFPSIAESSPAEGLRVDFLDVGKADAMILTTGDMTIVIDAATNSEGKAVVKRLNELGCSQVDLMIITHFDKDHVGGADKVIKALPVSMVYVPDYVSTSKQTLSFYEAAEEYDVLIETLTEDTAFNMGPLHFEINVAKGTDYDEDDENNRSLVTSLDFGEIRILFAGDAENKRLRQLLEEGIGHYDVLKVPHHGRAEKLTEAFIEAVRPGDAIITSSNDKLEESAVLRALETAGSKVWLTREGTVVLTTDGETISMVQE